MGGASWEHVQSKHASSSPLSPNNSESSSAPPGNSGNINNSSGNSAVVDTEAVLAAVTAGLRRGEKRFGVTVNQNMCCCFTFRPDWAVSATMAIMEVEVGMTVGR